MNVTKTKIKKAKAQDADVQEFISFCKDSFGEIRDRAYSSEELITLGIEDSFALFIKEAIANPIDISYLALSAYEKSFTDLLNDFIVKPFLKNKKESIKKMYRYKNDSNLLHYTIFLNEYSDSLKSPFIDFSYRYDQTKFATKVSIVFQVVPNVLEEDFEEEIKTGHFEEV